MLASARPGRRPRGCRTGNVAGLRGECRQGLAHAFHVLAREVREPALEVVLGVGGAVTAVTLEEGGDHPGKLTEAAGERGHSAWFIF